MIYDSGKEKQKSSYPENEQTKQRFYGSSDIITDLQRKADEHPEVKEAQERQRRVDESPKVRALAELQRKADESPMVRASEKLQRKADESPQVQRAQELQRRADESPRVRALAELQRKADEYIRAKYNISNPTDPAEKEADRIAGQVTGITPPVKSVDKKEIRCKENDSGQFIPASIPGQINSAVSSGGSSLPTGLKKEMESRMGHDFSQVKVHNDQKAHQSAAAINAKAYTKGSDIVFAKGEYSPGSSEGKHLIAHELVHVEQQGMRNQLPNIIKRTTSDANSLTEIVVGDNRDKGFIRCVLNFSNLRTKDFEVKKWDSDENTKKFIIKLSNTTIGTTQESPISVNTGGIRNVKFAIHDDGSTWVVVEADKDVTFYKSGHGKGNKLYFDFNATQSNQQPSQKTSSQKDEKTKVQKTTKPTTISFTKPQRSVHTVFIHCSASDEPAHDNAATIKGWHMNGNGWDDIGYHYIIRKNGTIETGRSLEKNPYAQKSYNPGTIAICLTGLKKSKFTSVQFTTVKSICNAIENAYSTKLKFRGHCEVANKSCPVFDYKEVLNIDGSGYRK